MAYTRTGLPKQRPAHAKTSRYVPYEDRDIDWSQPEMRYAPQRHTVPLRSCLTCGLFGVCQFAGPSANDLDGPSGGGHAQVRAMAGGPVLPAPQGVHCGCVVLVPHLSQSDAISLTLLSSLTLHSRPTAQDSFACKGTTKECASPAATECSWCKPSCKQWRTEEGWAPERRVECRPLRTAATATVATPRQHEVTLTSTRPRRSKPPA